jgi:hypothetical protein
MSADPAGQHLPSQHLGAWLICQLLRREAEALVQGTSRANQPAA